MKYKIVTSGKTNLVTLDEISRNLKVQSDNFILSDGVTYLGIISHKTLALLATEFAHYALQNYTNEKYPESEICIALIRKWIEDDTSVSNEELRVAADDANAAAAYAAYAAAANAANAAGVDREKEFIRQGEFILDFLRSGKNLFLV
jgi:hypothetical protein